MAFKQKEFQALMERESVSDFIWARSWRDIPGTQIGLYELANDRWGCAFQIFPSVFVGPETERRLATFFNSVDLPDQSSVQFLSFASRNLTGYRSLYLKTHSAFLNKKPNLEHPELLSEMKNNKEDWFKRHANENVFNKGNDLRIRNFINLVCITIPKNKKENIPFKESELVSFFSKVEQGISDFSPQKFTSREWVAIMREILVPDNPLWYPPEDNINELNYQVTDTNSLLILNDDSGSMGIGHLLNKSQIREKYIKNQKLKFGQNYQDTSNEITEEEFEDLREKGFLSSMSKILSGIFKGKKEEEEELKEVDTNWFAKVYTTKMFPRSTSLLSMNSKFYDFLGNKVSPTIPCPFMVSLCIYYENREKIKTEVSSKAKWNLWQTETLGRAARFFPEIVERANESKVINELLHEGETPVYASWSCVLMDDSETKVSNYGEILKKEFLTENWVLQEEILIPHLVFFSHLPLNFEPFALKTLAKRMNTVFSGNAAAITPIITGEKGYGAPILNYIDRGGQAVGVDIFQSDTNYNFVVVGTSGSGKSFTMADFFSNYLMSGAKIRVIDVGRSYKSLCSLVGGEYIEFTEDANLCLNFFTNILTDESTGMIHEDELQTLVPLIGLMAMQSVAPDDVEGLEAPVIASFISQAITKAFEKKQRNAGMQDVVDALQKMAEDQKKTDGDADLILKHLIEALYPFGNPDGEFFSYFNGANNLNFSSDFVVLELEEIDKKPLLKLVVLASISHNIQTEFFMSDRSQNKILVVDEAWSIMDNKIIVKFLETAARRIRKYNGASGIITQNLDDFSKNTATQAIYDNSAWKFFLKQNKSALHIAQKSGKISMNEGMVGLLETLQTKTPFFSEILIQPNSGAYFINRLIVDKVNYWIYTTRGDDVAEVEKISKEYGISQLDARLIKGFSITKNISIEDEFRERESNGKIISYAHNKIKTSPLIGAK